MGNPIGLQVKESQGLTTPVLTPGNLTNVGLISKSLLGPVNKVVQISSLRDYEIIFGKCSPSTPLYSYYETRGLYTNASPYDCNMYVIRATSSSGTASSASTGSGGNLVTYERAYLGELSPGVEGNNYKIEVLADGANFKLNVYYADSSLGDILVETISGLTTANVSGVLASQSKYIKATVTGTGALATLVKTSLASGADPTAITNIGSPNTALFDNYSIQILFAPDFSTSTDAGVLEAYCAGRNDCMAVSACPYATTTANVDATYSTSLLKSQSFLASYFNWVSISNVNYTDTVWSPGIGHVIGAYYINKLNGEGSNAFVPPAGLSKSLSGVLAQKLELSSAVVESLVHTSGVNVIQFYKGYGFVVRTSRTMSTTSKYYSIHIRRSINYLVSTLRSQLGIYEQRPNNPETRLSLKSTLDMFLLKEYQKGMFEKEGGYNNNVLVKCNEQNNDVTVRQNRQLVCDVFLNFAEVAETVTINLVQIQGSLTQSNIS